MPPASPVPGWASGEVCTDNTATRRGRSGRREGAHRHVSPPWLRQCASGRRASARRIAPIGSAYSPPSETTPAPASCTRLPNAVTRMSRDGITDRVGERGLDEVHALRILGERLAADHEVVRVEHVAQQGDGFAEHPRPLAPAATRACSLPCRAARSTAVIVDAGPSGGDDPRLAGGDQHRLVADGGLQLPGAAQQLGVARAARRWCRARWRANAPAHRSTARSRRSRGRRRRGWSTLGVGLAGARPSSSSAPAIASTCDATETGRPSASASTGSDRGVRPAQPRVVEVARGAVDDAAGGDADPQRAAAVPAAQVAAGAAGERRQRGGLGTARRRGLDDVERAPEQVGGHDAGGAGADVDAQRQERLVVDLDRAPAACRSHRRPRGRRVRAAHPRRAAR